MSSRHISSGLADGERELKASAKKETLLVTFGTVIRGVSQRKCSDQDEELFLLWGRLIHQQDCS